ncbi:hypothetical protein CKALI_05350 [Corynebacterium kalinowskii]|uniref:Uncharacterized protein n=1 Tax=Corynebacterium kalinowskii TaxID=2675216 RepID=A0A6B8VQ45_9CORY|nr:hypothetical protein CKALI_05350 [Corynebacterium kalinowskii]
MPLAEGLLALIAFIVLKQPGTSDVLFTVLALLIICSVLAAVLTLFLSAEKTRTQWLLFAIGAVLTPVGAYFMIQDAGEPVMFSLGILLYLGGPVLISALFTLIHRALKITRTSELT